MNEKRNNIEEKTLFRDALGDVKPLRTNRIEPYRRRLPPRPLHLDTGEKDETLQEHYAEQVLETPEVLHFVRPGIQQRLMHDLRRGHLLIDAELDLHGLTVRYAREDLCRFLQACHQRGFRCVRIIHGKGFGSEGRQPVLKQKLNLWLRQRDDVLAFTSAPRHDGGTGAAYVLLRNLHKRQWR